MMRLSPGASIRVRLEDEDSPVGVGMVLQGDWVHREGHGPGEEQHQGGEDRNFHTNLSEQ
jgi:hypothetical protein